MKSSENNLYDVISYENLIKLKGTYMKLNYF